MEEHAMFTKGACPHCRGGKKQASKASGLVLARKDFLPPKRASAKVKFYT